MPSHDYSYGRCSQFTTNAQFKRNGTQSCKKLRRHGKAQSNEFDAGVKELNDVLECHAVTGEADYLLRVMVPDLAALSEFMMHKLLRLPGVRSVKSNVVLQGIKRTTCLPLDHLRYSSDVKTNLSNKKKR